MIKNSRTKTTVREAAATAGTNYSTALRAREGGATAMDTDRIFSRNPEHLREDLEASLHFALVDEYANRPATIQAIIDGLQDFDDSQSALLAVKTQLGIPAFGQVLLYHLNNRTSLMGQSASMTHARALERFGMTVVDLGWPNEALNPAGFRELAPPRIDQRDERIHDAKAR